MICWTRICSSATSFAAPSVISAVEADTHLLRNTVCRRALSQPLRPKRAVPLIDRPPTIPGGTRHSTNGLDALGCGCGPRSKVVGMGAHKDRPAVLARTGTRQGSARGASGQSEPCRSRLASRYQHLTPTERTSTTMGDRLRRWTLTAAHQPPDPTCSVSRPRRPGSKACRSESFWGLVPPANQPRPCGRLRRPPHCADRLSRNSRSKAKGANEGLPPHPYDLGKGAHLPDPDLRSLRMPGGDADRGSEQR